MEFEFVDAIPREVDENTLYISIKYNTAIHKCACGCGEEVATPLSPLDWSLTYNGEAVSLYPSIGNWSYKCGSHYWIRNNQIEWSELMTKKEINRNRKTDIKRRKRRLRRKRR